jgi:PAS domain S-box-containing protein
MIRREDKEVKKEKLLFRNRILLLILLPVLVVGIIISGFSISYLTPPLVSFIKNNIDADLELASKLGMTVCENSLNYLLDLRLENDIEMNAALKQETVEEIKGISKQLHKIHMLIIEDNRTLMGSSLNLKDEKLIFPKLNIGENEITTQNLWGDPVRINYRYFPFWNWTIVSLISEADYMSPILLAKNIIYWGTLGVLAVVLLTLFLAFTLFVNIPLKRVIGATEEIADGKFQKINIRRNDEIGQLVHSFNSMIDSLDKKDADVKNLLEALKTSEYRFRTLFENTPIGIGVTSFNGEAIECNDAMLQLVGSAKSEIKRINFKDIYYSPNEGEMLIKEVQKRGAIHNVETKMKRNDGAIYHARLNISQIELDDKNVLLIIAEDITSQKNLEIQLQQAHKMESIGTLAGGIAHDFNNILGIIVGNTELAIDDVSEWNPARQNMEEIRTASFRARDVVRQLLSFARQTKLEKKPTNIIPIVKESLKLLRSSIPTSTEIRQNIPIDIDTILADPTQINQVLINLCTNADHAMPDGGIIKVILKNVELGENATAQYHNLNPGRYVNLIVSDTGHGIPKEEIDRIFDPYFTTKEVGKGTGMGLAVVHGIVKGHNGLITVESELEKGTTFSMFFPVVEKEAVVETESDEDLPAGNERILFVDDEESIAKLGHRRLERLGYKLESTTSPIKALALFRSQPDQFDLIITDLTMPKMTGDKLVKEILNIRSDIPIILCTGFSEKIDEKKAKEIGAADYIEKPLDKCDFAFKVRKVLDEE